MQTNITTLINTQDLLAMALTGIIKIKSFSGKDAIYIEENNDLNLYYLFSFSLCFNVKTFF